jgi:hypothetical protein
MDNKISKGLKWIKMEEDISKVIGIYILPTGWLVSTK